MCVVRNKRVLVNLTHAVFGIYKDNIHTTFKILGQLASEPFVTPFTYGLMVKSLHVLAENVVYVIFRIRSVYMSWYYINVHRFSTHQTSTVNSIISFGMNNTFS